jgi:hypothetical protein
MFIYSKQGRKLSLSMSLRLARFKTEPLDRTLKSEYSTYKSTSTPAAKTEKLYLLVYPWAFAMVIALHISCSVRINTATVVCIYGQVTADSRCYWYATTVMHGLRNL